MTRRVETTRDGVGGRHHVWHGEEQRADTGDNGSEADPAGNVALTTQVADDDRRQYATHLDGGCYQTRERAANLEPLFDRRDDAVDVAGRQRTCSETSRKKTSTGSQQEQVDGTRSRPNCPLPLVLFSALRSMSP